MQNPMSNSSRQDLFDLPVNPDVLFADHKNIYKGVAAEPKPEEILSASWNNHVKIKVP